MALSAGSLVRVANIPTGSFNTIVNATGNGTIGANNNGVNLFTAGSYGSRVTTLIASSSDTAARTVYVYIYRGGVDVIPLGAVAIPALSGFNATTKNVDFLNGANIPGLPYDNTGRQYISLDAGDVLKASVSGSTAVTAGTNLWLHAYGLNYQAP